MHRLARLTGACLALATAAAAAAPPEPRIELLIPRLEATDSFVWRLPLQVVNPLPVGIFCDSVIFTVEDLDSARTRSDQPVVAPRNLIRTESAISAHDSMTFSYQGTALLEHARLTFVLYAHDRNGRRHTSRLTQEAFPGRSSRRFPSQFLDVGGHRVETVLVHSYRRQRPAPGILLVHGHASHARYLLPRAWQLANAGYTVMIVSQPGYGLSEGEADLMGPATLAAAGAALDQLAHTSGVDSTRLGAWGWSRGATVVAELAARRGDLRAIVTQSGIYDLWATWRGTRLAGFREAIVAEAGSDSAAWKARSPLLDHARIRASTLVMHGGRDSHVPVEQAKAFLAALRADGARAEGRFFDDAEHALPFLESYQAAREFLDRELGQHRP